jgi:Domain of unknown function (DUF5680)
MSPHPAPLDEGDLLRFLLDASSHGYAAGHEAVTVSEADHSTTIVYERDEWKFHDNYFGGEPYGGRAVVFLNARPIWMAVYYGRVEGANVGVQAVYSFLQRALRRPPEDLPFRGPDEFFDGPFTYRSVRHGGVADFWGDETIHHGGQHVYTARYTGGLVDRRSGE